jgi:hypothetical protein
LLEFENFLELEIKKETEKKRNKMKKAEKKTNRTNEN